MPWEAAVAPDGQQTRFGGLPVKKAPFPGLGILFPSPIQTKKTTQSCDPTRRLSKTVKVVSIRLLVVEKKIIPYVLLTSDFEGRRKSRSSINRHF